MLQKPKKHYTIFFSGGVDSTYMAWKALKDGHDISLVYVDILNNGAKPDREKKQAGLIITELNKEFKTHLNLEIIGRYEGIGVNFGLPQAALWAFNAAMCMPDKNTEVWIGYVMNDDAISYLADINKAYKAFESLNGGRTVPKLKFPLYKTCKQEIRSQLPGNYLELTISCEAPRIARHEEYYDCGNCAACKRRVNEFGLQSIRLLDHIKESELGLEPADSRKFKDPVKAKDLSLLNKAKGSKKGIKKVEYEKG